MWAEIEMTNAQSIEHALITLPKTGIVRFAGRNRNGKSIFEKWLEESVAVRIGKPRTRRSLIRKGQQEGRLRIKNHDGRQILIVINLDASRTYVEYEDARKQQKYRRYLADKKESIQSLFRMFGLHYNEKRDMSLNIFKTFGPIMFLNTPFVANFDMLSEALSDKNVDMAVDREEIYLTELKEQKVKIEETLQIFTMKEQALEFYDIAKEEAKYKLCTTYANIIDALKIPKLQKLPNLPDIKSISALEHIPVMTEIGMLPIKEINGVKALNIIPETRELPKVPDIVPIIALSNIPSTHKLGVLPDVQPILAIQEKSILIHLGVRLPILAEAKSLLDSAFAIKHIPDLPPMKIRLKEIDTCIKCIDACNSIPQVPDVSSDLTNLYEVYEAYKNKVCPLCGSKILEVE